MANSDHENEFIKRVLFTNYDNVRYEPSSQEVQKELRKLNEKLQVGHACPTWQKLFEKIKSNKAREICRVW